MTHVPTWNVPPVHKNIMDAPPPPNTASVNDIRAQGELPSRLACHWIWLSPGLWCPSCSISVWLWDSRLKQTLIIPLVKHADKSCFFFYFKFLRVSLFWHMKRMCHGALRYSNSFLCTLQGEIGEKGQKVNI